MSSTAQWAASPLLLRRPPRFSSRTIFSVPGNFQVVCAKRSVISSFWRLQEANRVRILPVLRAEVAHSPPLPDSDMLFSETFPLRRTQPVEGKIIVRLDRADEETKRKLVIGCNLEGKWILHWGVTYFNETGSEWDQPPSDMRPPGSIPIKDYAIETPLTSSSSSLEGEVLYEAEIDLDIHSSIAAIHFVLKEEETGAWIQHKGRDFRIPLMGYPEEGKDATTDGKQGLTIWSGAFNQISKIMLKAEGSHATHKEAYGNKDAKQQPECIDGVYEEYSIMKEVAVQNSLTVTVRKSNETDDNLILFETDIPGDVIIHWGVCRDDKTKWEIPAPPHPLATKVFRKKALQTLLQPKADGPGNWGLFPVKKEVSGLLFVLKLSEYVWLNNMGTDFYIPLRSVSSLPSQASRDVVSNEQLKLGGAEIATDSEEKVATRDYKGAQSSTSGSSEDVQQSKLVDPAAYTDEIISEIRNLVSDISSEKGTRTKSKEAQENILQEIEKLAAEAYSIFRTSTTTFTEEPVSAPQSKPAVKVCSGTGSGYEILCQGFNWESHKSGKWYIELGQKIKELASFGFTIVWLPPPTESVSPEGYMPKDLYNLNSRYGNMEELKELVRNFHGAGIKVLGDAVLNHRCAHYQNSNGIWNIFGGRLNWDDRAIVADDPHFQGRGNKSSGDNFHAAPNIDHSQDFVRKDLKEWLCWLRKEVGYDGWRLDFVRGFWGGYVKDYLEASEPYFAVGEYWDSLSYTYGEMDHNQDAHRQRIVDWINATNGTAGAFDVTTKGILHSALEKCEYWRLSDEKGKPPGVVGWWPSRAVTFIENHDTGSTQGHWRFPSGKEMQGYAYILTHPGTPAIFFDHIFSHYQDEIGRLIALRNRAKLHCRSTVKITKAERDVYAAEIDEKVAMKIGPGHYEPTSGSKNWVVATEGKDYTVWEAQ